MNDSQIARQLKDARLLVTGATGMIGCNVVNYLLELNDKYKANISLLLHHQSI